MSVDTSTPRIATGFRIGSDRKAEGRAHRRRPVPGGALSSDSSEFGGSPHVRQSVFRAARWSRDAIPSPFGAGGVEELGPSRLLGEAHSGRRDLASSSEPGSASSWWSFSGARSRAVAWFASLRGCELSRERGVDELCGPAGSPSERRVTLRGGLVAL